MSSSLPPLNLSATAITVLQTRSSAAGAALRSALQSEKAATQLLQQASETLAADAAQSSGGTPPRGTLLNIVV
jgi:hypothetical protein